MNTLNSYDFKVALHISPFAGCLIVEVLKWSYLNYIISNDKIGLKLVVFVSVLVYEITLSH